MLGFSVYLSEIDEQYINDMLSKHFTYIFTSIQIPEEKNINSIEKLELLKKIVDKRATIIVDLNPGKLKDISVEVANDLFDQSVAIRFDETTDLEELLSWYKRANIVLNASTDGINLLRKMRAHDIDYSKIILAHNYYPRPETGLSEHYFFEVNQKLKNEFKEIIVLAFICGDTLRGPLFEGLPTLEQHRHLDSISAYLELKSKDTDLICIGDTKINKFEATRLSHLDRNNQLVLRVSIDSDYQFLTNISLKNRDDESRDVIRIEEGRKHFKLQPLPHNTIARKTGTITIDNHLYGRYVGELQITKCHLISDEKVNVIGAVIDSDIKYLRFIKSGQKILLMNEGDENEY